MLASGAYGLLTHSDGTVAELVSWEMHDRPTRTIPDHCVTFVLRSANRPKSKNRVSLSLQVGDTKYCHAIREATIYAVREGPAPDTWHIECRGGLRAMYQPMPPSIPPTPPHES